MKYFLTVSYDGSKFNGLQKLKNEITVQGELEKVLTKLDNSFVQVKFAGRTDKGVHATNQKCHFELKTDLTPYRLRYYINRMTSKYLYVRNCEIINDDYFHARFSVKEKEYLYKINTGEYNPILNDYLYNYNKSLDIEKLREASNHFLGIHNFKMFTTGNQIKYDCKINKIEISSDKEIVIIKISGKSFLTYMVRNIISILILYSESQISLEEIDKMLDGKKILEYAKVPARGLYLNKIEY